MKKQALENFDLTALPIIALLIFLAVFIGVVVWVFRKGSEKKYKKLSNFPLNKD